MKYLKKLSNHDAYAAFIVGAEFDNTIHTNAIISYCKTESHVHYNPYITPIPKFLDILYSDVNGNLSFTSDVLPVSEGKTPIGLCIAGQGFFGANEKARWMSLKYMNYTTPETGSLNEQDIYWCNDMDSYSFAIDDLYYGYNGNVYNAQGWLDDSPALPAIYTESNQWNISELGTINEYAMTNINGKILTNDIIYNATSQPSWQTDISIENVYGAGYTPAVCCCKRYHTLGTQAGDWYLGGCGEMAPLLYKYMEINLKLYNISRIYPNDCMSQLYGSEYCTSSYNSYHQSYTIAIDFNGISARDGDSDYFKVISLLSW